MSVRRCLRVAALVSTVVFYGCAGTEPPEDLEEPVVAPRSDGTSGGTNGGSSDDQNELEPWILDATTVPLVSPGTNDVHPDIVAGLLAQPGGAGVFKYMVECALPKTPEMPYVRAGLERFYAKGHMTRAHVWRTKPLGAEAVGDLAACLAAHRNAYLAHVPIVIQGLHVHDDGLDHSEQSLLEAAWYAEPQEGELHYTIWPTEAFYTNCNDDPISVLWTRICGLAPVQCEMTDGGLYEDQCEESDGSVKCDGKTVIKTLLRPADFGTLNPTCVTNPNP